MYAQTTDDVQWSGILRDVERKKSTELSFPPCGDREISVGDLSFLSFLSRSSAPSRLQSPWPSSLEERSTDAHRRRTHSSRDATRPSAACGFVSFGSQHPGLRRNCRPWGNCRPYSSLLLNSSSCLIVRVVPHSPHYSCENSSIAIIIVRISPHKSAEVRPTHRSHSPHHRSCPPPRPPPPLLTGRDPRRRLWQPRPTRTQPV